MKLSLVALMAALLSSPLMANESQRWNVLMIAIDDLRPALGCYGDTIALTPNIDRLARRGTVFRRAYCQQAVCSPSRLSLMTGRRPDTTQVWDLSTHFRSALPDVITLPQYFREHGYETSSVGKIYHGSGKPSQDPPSWSISPEYDVVRDPAVRYATKENLRGKGLKRAASESAEVADDQYIDGVVCRTALNRLGELSRRRQPFFLAVGFRKPHLPFCAPKKYWDLYDRQKIPWPVSSQHPSQAPELAVRSWQELEGYSDIPSDGELSRRQVLELRHGYYACVSYVDALVGRLLDELQELKLLQNTVVLLWGDHGYHLGEQGLWTKANNYELSTRVPLIVAVPGQARPGSSTAALVELVDVFPTLVDLCGLSLPSGLEGVSLRPLIKQPNRVWKRAVFSQYPRARQGSRHRGHGEFMGYAVRSDRYRYVQWREWGSERVVAAELYDHQFDPHEMNNLAGQPGHREVIRMHSRILDEGWRLSVPAAVGADDNVPGGATATRQDQ